MRTLLAVDDVIYRVERAVVAGMLVLMGLVVFLDVIHRVSTRSGSPLASPLVVASAATVVAAMALRTREVPMALPKGAAVGVAVAAFQFGFIRLVPNGLVWSQTLALALTLWLGTIGASLAAHDRRHLALDVGSKLWSKAMAPRAAALGHLITALFCLLLLWLSVRSVSQHIELWTATEGSAGTLSGTSIPRWTAYLAIPYGTAVLAFRFLLESWRTWRGDFEIGGDDTLHMLGIDAGEIDGGIKGEIQ
jgi:TRAP-type C4-dicarboxylate transport system permease small subunit